MCSRRRGRRSRSAIESAKRLLLPRLFSPLLVCTRETEEECKRREPWPRGRGPNYLQAMVRRGVHPRGTTDTCGVDGCSATLTIDHILLTTDTKHLNHIRGSSTERDPHLIFPRPCRGNPHRSLQASPTDIMHAFAHGDRDVMQLVATRFLSLSTEPLITRWSQWLLSFLRKPP